MKKINIFSLSILTFALINSNTGCTSKNETLTTCDYQEQVEFINLDLSVVEKIKNNINKVETEVQYSNKTTTEVTSIKQYQHTDGTVYLVADVDYRFALVQEDGSEFNNEAEYTYKMFTCDGDLFKEADIAYSYLGEGEPSKDWRRTIFISTALDVEL